MTLPTLTLRSKQNAHDVNVRRMTTFEQCQIVESTDAKNRYFYLFFHKCEYLNYVSASQLPTRSFIHDAFKNGITFSSTHPLTQSVLTHSTYKKKDFNALFTRLKERKGREETALIATYFAPFIKKAKLAQFIQTLFYEQRRSGKMLSCYRIYRKLEHFAPNHPLVEAFSGDLTFVEFEKRYHRLDDDLIAQDPLYFESRLFKNRLQPESFHTLRTFYEQPTRHVEQAALIIQHTAETQSPELYHTAKEMDDTFRTRAFYEDLYDRGLRTPVFLSDYLNVLIEEKDLPTTTAFISEQQLSPTPEQSQALIQLVKQETLPSLSPKTWQELIIFLFESGQPLEAVEILERAIGSLLSEREMNDVTEWVQAFGQFPQTHPVIQKVQEMQSLLENPDEQRRLGKLYYHFHQPDRAIECMSFDMELYETDPEPVQWLAKLYDEVGNEEEHTAYKQLFMTMMKHQQ
ncbi:hypothetical protein LCM20_18000 [Halobacillus litoralis]|uniref:tetratricopeptide repeat protein n=1 Tax=Halobacillus litoralis TaxID=45668 RepID=UPI001CD7B255|nr:hypothetical protein [Halobacillus litoralis]MCA0972493.1 hypothetical protein [Halobacillus litoralis]